MLLIDSERPFEEQDLRLADLVIEEGRALVLAISQSDLAALKNIAPKDLRAEADHWLPQAKGMPVVPISGLTGEGIERLLDAVVKIHEVWKRRVPTAALNRFLDGAIQANAPPAVSGARIKLRYMTQAQGAPPSFVLFGTAHRSLPESYLRYLGTVYAKPSICQAFRSGCRPARLRIPCRPQARLAEQNKRAR